MAVFDGDNIQGQWGLTVKDLLADDQGRLDDWTLEIEYESTEQIITTESHPRLAIPDNNRTGVQDSINVDVQGEAVEVSVTVDIRHTYRGDLTVQLIAPSGEIIVLKDVEGDPRPDLKVTFTTESTPALQQLTGTQIQGDWTLVVRDLWSADTGTIDKWSLQIKYE